MAQADTDAGPAYRFGPVTPGAALPNGRCKALYVGTPGDVNVTSHGVTGTFKNVSGWFYVECDSVNTSGTTASDIMALY